MKTVSRFPFLVSRTLILLCVSVSLWQVLGCVDWERTTFQLLSADKALIEQAGEDYNAKKIAQTPKTYQLILKAGAVHNTAVDAFKAYKQVKDSGAGKDQVNAAIDKVNIALQELAPLIADLRAIRSAGQIGPGTVPGKPAP